tara:strand:- start:603 stop:1784 length:1182 start_codon:yes stop_codon:yes gene_type:complete
MKKNIKNVFVCDGRSRAALSIIRSIGKKNINVIVGESFKCSSFYSKYALKKIIYPCPQKELDEFKKFIIDYLFHNKIDVFIPVRDDTTEFVVKNYVDISKLTSIVVPSKKSFNASRDKSETIKFARKLDIPHPKTILTENEKYNIKLLKKEFHLPILIKPRISSGSRGIKIVYNWDDFEFIFNEVSKEYPFPLIQEFIPHGGAFGVSVLYDKNKLKAFFTHKRIREFPESGGPSTLREGVHFEEIEKYSFKLMTDINWNGVAMIEYRIDKKTNEPKLMEINPRFWGSLETAVFSGVDFPNLLYELSINKECDYVLKYKEGKRVRWLFFGDLLWFLNTKKTINNIKSFFVFKNKNLSYDIFSLNDLGPLYGSFIEAFTSFFKKDRRKHAFKRGW